jgi:hypothetical protein
VFWLEIAFGAVVILLLGFSAIALYSIYIQVEFASKRLSEANEHLSTINDRLRDRERR